jgi:hypothetical protein
LAAGVLGQLRKRFEPETDGSGPSNLSCWGMIMQVSASDLWVEQKIPEQRLWIAVLTQAVVEWQSGNLRRSGAAEAFLFRDGEDFSVVCSAAGFDPGQFRAKLERISKRPGHLSDAVPSAVRAAPRE